MNPIRRYYVIPIVIAIVSIIVIFGFGSSDSTSENIESVFMGYDGQITRVIDGDTLLIGPDTIRLSLVNSPERDERGYQEAKDFASTVCFRICTFNFLPPDPSSDAVADPFAGELSLPE